PSDRRDAGSRGDVLAAISAPGWVRYIVSAASDPTVASRAGADRLRGRNRRFVYDVSITNNCPSDLMSHSVKLSVKGMKSSEKFWRVMTNLSLFHYGFCYFMSVLNRVYRPCPSVVKSPKNASYCPHA